MRDCRVSGGVLGRDATRTKEGANAYQRSNYLVASSYGPVYALLGDNGKSFFVANAVQGTNAYFDLKSDPEGTINRANEKLLPGYQKIIRGDVEQIANLYRYRYHAPTFRDWLMH